MILMFIVWAGTVLLQKFKNYDIMKNNIEKKAGIL